MSQEKKNMSVIDLFCGAGGLSHGLRCAGFSVVLGIDSDPACRYPFEHNNSAQFLEQDIRAVKGSKLKKYYPKNSLRILVGCAPCQPFSTYTLGTDTSANDKWSLLEEYARLVRELKPEIVSMENVPGLTRHSIFDDFLATLKEEKYHASHSVVFCPDYGIPQTRSRLVLLASKRGPIKLIPPTSDASRYATVRETIERLPRLEAGEIDTNDPLHRASKLTPRNYARMLASTEGGTWKNWPEELIVPCHRDGKGDSYPSIYGRMKWDEPAPTITTLFYGFGNGRFGHPEQNRALSLREGALLQTFPASYCFVPQSEIPNMRVVGRLIGNAVPVRLGEAIGFSIKKHLEES